LPAKGSTAKRYRQSVKRRLSNRSIKSNVKTEIKKYLTAIEEKDAGSAENQFKTVSSLIDKAARKGVIHKNTAARKKSRLNKQLNDLKSSET
jgi:small subunit ribosomal protein S20